MRTEQGNPVNWEHFYLAEQIATDLDLTEEESNRVARIIADYFARKSANRDRRESKATY